MKEEIIAIVPAYNEEKHLVKVIEETKKYVDKIIVINDGSTDKTVELAEKAGAEVINFPINRGLGASLATGIKAAKELDANIAITLDGDGQHDPSYIPILIKLITEGNYDVVIGARKENKKSMPLIKKIGNNILNNLTLLLYGLRCSDTQSGFRAFNRKALNSIKIKVDRYGVSSEIIGEIKKNKLRLKEIGIPTIYHDKNKGTTAWDGVKIFLNLMIRRFL